MDEIALEPPRAKKEAYWSKSEVMAISVLDRFMDERQSYCSWKIPKRGTFVARDWVKRKRLRSDWNVVDQSSTKSA